MDHNTCVIFLLCSILNYTIQKKNHGSLDLILLHLIMDRNNNSNNNDDNNNNKHEKFVNGLLVKNCQYILSKLKCLRYC